MSHVHVQCGMTMNNSCDIHGICCSIISDVETNATVNLWSMAPWSVRIMGSDTG